MGHGTKVRVYVPNRELPSALLVGASWRTVRYYPNERGDPLQTEAERTTTECSTLLILKELAIKVAGLKIAPTEIRDDASLFDDCGLDSTSVVDMVFEIEAAFGINIPEEEIDAELLQNIGKLAEFVDAKRAERIATGTE